MCIILLIKKGGYVYVSMKPFSSVSKVPVAVLVCTGINNHHQYMY